MEPGLWCGEGDPALRTLLPCFALQNSPFGNPWGCDIPGAVPRQPELQIAGEPVLVEINVMRFGVGPSARGRGHLF